MLLLIQKMALMERVALACLRLPQHGPKFPLDGPKMARNGPKMASKMAQTGPNGVLRRAQNASTNIIAFLLKYI